MAYLPVDRRGYPVPYFVSRVNDEWDFRVVQPEKQILAMKNNLCWICGQSLGIKKAFVTGPMCVITKTSAEPPSHLSCAQYAAIACPFLASPRMKRNAKDLPESHVAPSGIGIMRNPGVAAVLVTRSWKPFSDSNGGVLIRMGDPEEVEWYAERKRATREQVIDSIMSGLRLLVEECENEETEKDKDEAIIELTERINDTMKWLPSI